MTTSTITRPDPDPTVLTTQALLREVAMLKELLVTKIEGVDRYTAIMDRLLAMQDASHGDLKAEVKEWIGGLQRVFNDRFDAIERNRVEQKKDTKDALDAALQAAKELVGGQNVSNSITIGEMKSTFTKQIEAAVVQIQAAAKTNDDKNADLKDRVVAIEGRQATDRGHSKGIGDSWGVLVGVLGAVGLIVGIVVGVAGLLHH